jgi:hypothetical protein
VKQYVKLLKGKRLESSRVFRNSALLLPGVLSGLTGQHRFLGRINARGRWHLRVCYSPALHNGLWDRGVPALPPGCWHNGFKRPVLKHGPRSATRSRVFGFQTLTRNESESRYPLLGHRRPSLTFSEGLAVERVRCDPKDGELFLRRVKPEETLVEARSGSDVQIDRRTWE